MGEQRMKTLRGKKSDDIIFSGSETKGQLSLASVSLTIDNADHALPIEYDELIITRRIYRTGESEYLINESPVRLLDVQLLLAKAQFGQGSYSIVGQGMIDRMLLQTPAERKTFFDEASGIKELQIKRHQAALKLARTNENMNQANLLLAEVEPRLKTLTRQMKKLEERKMVEEELRRAQETYYATLWKEYDDKRRDLQAEVGQLDVVIGAGEKRLLEVQTQLAELANASSRQDMYRTLQKEYEVASEQVNTLERDRALLSGKLQTEYTEAGQQTVGWLEQNMATAKADIERLATELSGLEMVAEAARKELETMQAEHHALLLERTEVLSSLAKLEEHARNSRHEQQLFQAIGLKAVQAILESRGSFGTVYGAVAQLGTANQEFQLALDVAAGAHVSSLVVADEQVAERCITFLRQEELGTATFLPLSRIRPRPAQVSEYILQTGGVHGRALDLITFEDRFESVFAFVFGNTVVVDAMPTARQIGLGQTRMVTLEGDLFEMNGSIKGGYRRRRTEGLSFGNRSLTSGATQHLNEADILTLTKRRADIDLRLERLQIDLRSRESSQVAAETKVTMLSEQKRNIEREASRLEQERALLTMSPEEYTTALKTLEEERDALDIALEKAKLVQQAASGAMATFNDEEEVKRRQVFALQDTMQTEQTVLNTLVDERNGKKIELAKCDTKCEDVGNEVYQELHESIASVRAREIPVVTAAALEQVLADIQKLKYKMTLIGGIDEDVIREHTETKERYDALSAELQDLTKAFNDLTGMTKELDEVMKKRRDKAFKRIRKEFSRYFEILFEGGKADLVEVYGPAETAAAADDELSEGEDVEPETGESTQTKKEEVLTGIEVVASPPGKKIKELASLSGGERTMTSIALICAILKTNPSPFVLLDEVEAALDEANTLRFTSILKELAGSSQFILITHNRTTMHATDALYGVTMGNDGISQLISVKLG
jgi:chromosome segregation protein